MPNYKYRAKKVSGEVVEGEMDAANKTAAYALLQRQDFFPVTLQEVKEQESLAKGLPLAPKKVKKKDIVRFTQGFADLLDSGVALSRALTIIADQSKGNKPLAQLIHVIHQDVIAGNTFSSALAKHPTIFPPLYSNMVYSGEVSGTLPKVLNELNQIFASEEELKGKVQSAMAYPVMMAVVGVGTVWVLLAFVIPRIATMFAEMGQTLPAPTRMLISASKIASQSWYIFLGGVIAAAVAFGQFYRTKPGRLMVDRIKLSIPILKEIELKSEVSRFARTLSSMLHSGIPIMSAMKIVSDIINNQVIAHEVMGIQADLKEGISFSNALQRCKTIPLEVKNVAAVGEESGHLEVTLGKTGEVYNREVEGLVKMLTSLMEPLMIVVMALVVGFMVVAMLLPIFDIKISG